MPGYKQVLQEVEEELLVQEKTQELNVPAVMGPPGIGKSALALDVAIRLERTYRPLNVGDNSDPTDIAGCPVPMGILNKIPNDSIIAPQQQTEWEESMVRKGLTRAKAEDHVERMVWALNKAAAEACMSPVLLFFDDFDKAPDAVMKGLIGLFGTRKFRDYALHPLSLLMAAGNRVGDDVLAGDISQSILGRVTVIEMEPNFGDFAEYARENPDEIHSDVLGFLASDPDMLYRPVAEGMYASPSPRGWKQVSAHFFQYPNHSPSKKARVVERKCGTGTKNTWITWFNILSKIDVDEILQTGKAAPPKGENEIMFSYACCFAVVRRLVRSKRISKRWVGIHPFVENLQPEYKIAFLVQLPNGIKKALGQQFPEVLSELMRSLVEQKDD